ncbi:SRPBCC family protein [Nocardioides sp.]|uniref:SRPBCC family protein n=1 Tax=Nocardioides sp. TaxID=35761 RepID=UPI0035174650
MTSSPIPGSSPAASGTLRTAVTRRTLRAAPSEVFDVLTDPERFAQVRGIRHVTVLQEGPDGPRSTGTVRRIGFAPVGFMVEEFIAVAPYRFDYRLVAASLPLDHRAGTIEFLPGPDGGTQARWETTYALPLPLVGDVAGRAAAPVVARVFHTVLGELDRVALRG